MNDTQNGSTSYYQRRLADFSNPLLVFPENDLTALIENSLTLGNQLTHLMIFADPRDGSSRLLDHSTEHLKKRFNVAVLRNNPGAPKGSPLLVQSLFGKKIENFWTKLRILWKSLTFTQQSMGVTIYICIAFLLHAVFVFSSAFKEGTSGQLTADSFFSLEAILPFAFERISQLILPFLGFTFYIYLSKDLSERALKKDLKGILDKLTDNSFKALISEFRSKYEKHIAPMLIIVDSVENLDFNFDTTFLFRSLIPYYKSKGTRIVVLAVSKLYGPSRLSFRDQLSDTFQDEASEIKFYTLENIGSEELSQISGKEENKTFFEGMTIGEALDLRIDSSLELEKDKDVDEFFAQCLKENDPWNPVLVAVLLATPFYVMRDGIDRNTFSSLFDFSARKAKSSVPAELIAINALAQQFGIQSDISSDLMESLFDKFFENHIRRIFQWDDSFEKYFLDRRKRRIINSKAPLEMRIFCLVIWMRILGFGEGRIPLSYIHFEIEHIGVVLNQALEDLNCNGDPWSYLADTTMTLMNRTRASGHGKACKTLALLFFLCLKKNPNLDIADNKSDANALPAFECFFLYSEANQNEFPIFDDSVPLPVNYTSGLFRLISICFSTNRWEESLSFQLLPENLSGGLSPVVKWLLTQRFRQHQCLPKLFFDNDTLPATPDIMIVNHLPDKANGFHFYTLCLLDSLSPLLDYRETFLMVWKRITNNIVQFNALPNLTTWERLWGEFVSVNLLSQFILLLARNSKTKRFNAEKFREDLAIDSRDKELLNLLGGVSKSLGLSEINVKSERLPVSWNQKLISVIDILRTKCLMIDNRGYYLVLCYLRSLVLWNVKDLRTADRENVLHDLDIVLSEDAPLLRRWLHVDALTLKCQVLSSVSRKLVADTFYGLLEAIHKIGVSESQYNEFVLTHIDELRFSHKKEHRRKAIPIMVSSLKRLEEQFDLNKNPLELISISDTYHTLALDIWNEYGDEKIEEVKELWRKGKAKLDEYAWNLSQDNIRFQVRDLELSYFTLKVAVFNLPKEQIVAEVIDFLGHSEYKAIPGTGFLRILDLGALYLPQDRMDLLVTGIEIRKHNVDEVSGSIWMNIFYSLFARLQTIPDTPTHSLHIKATCAVLANILESKLSLINIRLSRKMIFRFLGSTYSQECNEFVVRKIMYLHDELLISENSYEKLIKIDKLREQGKFGEIALAYYLFLRDYLTDGVGKDVIEELNELYEVQENHSEFKDKGLKVLEKYIKQGKEKALVSLEIIQKLEKVATDSNDNETLKLLNIQKTKIGIDWFESLLLPKNFLSTRVRDIINSDLKNLMSL